MGLARHAARCFHAGLRAWPGGVCALALVLAAGLPSLIACGSSRSAAVHREAASGSERAEPALSGAYRVAEMGGGPVLPALLDDPACYAGRALLTFHDDDTVSFSIETACEGPAAHETVCMAELTTAVEWQRDGFRVPVPVRARGMVTQFTHPDGEPSADFHDACQVGLTPMRWHIRERAAERLVLQNEHGDRMVLDRDEQAGDLDWSAVTRQARQRRLSALSRAPGDGASPRL